MLTRAGQVEWPHYYVWRWGGLWGGVGCQPRCLSPYGRPALASSHGGSYRALQGNKKGQSPMCKQYSSLSLVPQLLMSHWWEQVMWPGPESRDGKIKSTSWSEKWEVIFQSVCVLGWEESGSILQSTTLCQVVRQLEQSFSSFPSLNRAKEDSFLITFSTGSSISYLSKLTILDVFTKRQES